MTKETTQVSSLAHRVSRLLNIFFNGRIFYLFYELGCFLAPADFALFG